MQSAFCMWLVSPQTSSLLEPFLEPQMYINSIFLIFLLVSLVVIYGKPFCTFFNCPHFKANFHGCLFKCSFLYVKYIDHIGGTEGFLCTNAKKFGNHWCMVWMDYLKNWYVLFTRKNQKSSFNCQLTKIFTWNWQMHFTIH